MSLTKEQQIAADWLAWLNHRVDGLPKVYDEARDSLAELLATQHSVQRTCAHVWDEMLVGDEGISKQVCQVCGASR